MEIYNTHKEQLIENIESKIKEIDQQCRNLTKEIYLYSDERREELEREKEKEQQELDQLQQIYNNNEEETTELLKVLDFVKTEEESLIKELQEKQRANHQLEKQIIFLEEKQKEEAPHIQSYLEEKFKNKKSNQNIKYAKNKLNSLENAYLIQCKEVQYQYRLVSLMKEKLKTLKSEKYQEEINQNREESKYSKRTFETIEKNHKQEKNRFLLSCVPKQTEESISEEFID